MAEFKIGRLRFNWAGNWAPATFYNRDAVVHYNGKMYVCLVPNTSSTDFNDDLNYITPGNAPEPKWNLVVDGKTWKNEWQPETLYSLGNLVSFGGAVYVCTVAHTSDSIGLNPAKFDIYAQYAKWNKTWDTDYAYGTGDIVKYGGIVYVCSENHVSANTVNDGLEADIEKWNVLHSGIEYKGVWSNSTKYKLNDIVKLDSSLYKATVGHPPSAEFNDSDWESFLPGEEFKDTWSAITKYQTNDVVNYGGYTYISKTNNNTNNIPSTSTANWDILNTGYSLRNDWISGTGNAYKAGDIVRKNGVLYEAVADNQSQDPSAFSVTTTTTVVGSSGTTLEVDSTTSITAGMVVIGTGFTLGQSVISISGPTTLLLNAAPDGDLVDGANLSFVGVNYPYWKMLVPGNEWHSRWVVGTNYSLGDLVFWKEATYHCVQTHTATVNNRPDTDVDSAYWSLFVPHARKNALTTYGDLETYDNGQYSSVGISTENYVLRSTNFTPAWAFINTTPQVYYVAPTGIDQLISGYGTTWDKPWKTIKYACDTVGAGFAYPNVAFLLRENKEWLTKEMYAWMQYQIQEENTPFTSGLMLSEAKSLRDAGYLIDAMVYDLTREGNSQTIAATLAYFAPGRANKFFNDAVAEEMPYFIAALGKLQELIDNVISNTYPNDNFQELSGVELVDQVSQIIDTNHIPETTAALEIASLFDIVLGALSTEDSSLVPPQNSGVSVTVFIKTGTYAEHTPIIVPENVALFGDELRSVVVEPALIINTRVVATTSTDTVGMSMSSTMTLDTTEGITTGTPVQFNGTMGGVVQGQTYYASVISDTKIVIYDQAGEFGLPVSLTDNTSDEMQVFGGEAILDMFRMRNGSGLRNMTLKGKLGVLGPADSNTLRIPTGGSFACLDPGNGPDDTSVWIFRRSPYVQNVTAFGYGCAALKIDGTLHNGGYKSMVANDFTHIVSSGIGVWCTGPNALTEVISVFSYYGYTGYFAQAGGRIRAANGNSSYGIYGVIAEGYDVTETPASGNVYNQSSQTQAQVQQAFGATAEILKINYSNAGSEYDVSSTNLLKYSNTFTNAAWTSDGNVHLNEIATAPSGLTEAWSLTSSSGSSGASYIYQNISVSPKGTTYTGLSAVNISGSGSSATFDVTVTSTGYIVTVNGGGTNYATTNQLYISGGQLGGRNNVNDCVLTVASLAGSAILTVDVEGTVPTGSNQDYTLSVYVKEGTATTIDLYATFSGSSTVTSSISYNFNTGVVTPSSSGGYLPTLYGAQVTLSEGWYRLWFAVNDITGLNNNLQYRIYPRGYIGNNGAYTYIYGAQAEISNSAWLSSEPSFYLETEGANYTAYANFNITGAGTGIVAVGDELRSRSIFETRITDPGSGAGGDGYLTASNNGQSGTQTYMQLSQSDNNTQSNYIGMRLFIQSGTGAGQYGYISSYNDGTKIAQILRESFDTVQIISTSNSDNTLMLGGDYTTKTLYVDQQIQFIPTYYTTSVSSTSLAQTTISATTGGLINTLTVSSTQGMKVNMGITFSGTLFSNIVAGYTYYIYDIIDDTTLQISDQLYGNVWALNTATGTMTANFTSNTSYLTGNTTNMVVNYPVQFTGTALGGLSVGVTYYINDVIDGTHFTISSSLVEVVVTDTNPSNNGMTVSSTTSLVPLSPIIFSGTVAGNIVDGTKYYIGKIIDSTTFSVSSSLITLTATATEAVSNLITVSSTSGFVINNPIQFVGTSFGGINSETVYYILTINDSTTFTVSQTPGGGAISLTTATGGLTVRTAPAAFILSSSTGQSMNGTSTSSKKALTLATGSMNGTFSTALFGGVVFGDTYYVKTVDSNNNKITISTSPSGPEFTLTTKTGSMNLAEVGWDHINPGTPIESSLDNSSVYFIEPRATYSDPDFIQESATGTVNLAIGTSWVAMAYGDHYWMALPSGNSSAAGSSDGDNWTEITLPSVQSWTGIAYGVGYWVAISSGGSGNSKAIYSNSNGLGWRTVNLPSATTWSHVAYGNNKFVAIATGTGTSAYSTTYGSSWSSATGLPSATWTGLTYGKGLFVAVASGGTTAAYSADGTSWTATSLPSSAAWSSVVYGNGRYVAVSSTSNKAAYSFDAITWYESTIPVAGVKVTYGQGLFMALPSSGSTVAWTSDSGLYWKQEAVTDDGYGCSSFGWTDDSVTSRPGYFVTLAGRNTGSRITAGVRAKGRAIITSGVITSISVWEPGSGYVATPTVTFTDPNITSLATVTPRLSNGTLASPTFINRGSGYNTNSTVAKITGNGYADKYQTGFTIVLNNLTRLPQPGDNLTITGLTQIYKVTSARAVYGTVAPNLEANVEISPDMSIGNSPAQGASVSIRAKYSQARLTNHDFLNIGYGDFETSNYPGFPDTGYAARSQNQVLEVNYGRVFYTSTDQDGNFKVGNLFGVQQATGIVTLSATQFGLTGLTTLSLGGIAVGGSSVVIEQFSTDGSFTANSDNVVPTQKAIKTYLTSRLTQGGSNTATGQLIAGSVTIGGPNNIGSTVPNGTAGSVVNMPGMIRFQGPLAGVDGGMAALDYFVRGFTRRGNF